MEIAARLAKVTALIISRDVVIDYALYGTPELALVANNKARNPAVPRTLISRQIPYNGNVYLIVTLNKRPLAI
ncbi:hypothetical protein [Acinetobacter seifertii]|uniref:hypothetical protein n=1 Tax=Acinetobacter seifertii TaxID=1530123 RepID=UPI003F71868E